VRRSGLSHRNTTDFCFKFEICRRKSDRQFPAIASRQDPRLTINFTYILASPDSTPRLCLSLSNDSRHWMMYIQQGGVLLRGFELGNQNMMGIKGVPGF
jgi:hypothetical protein